MYRSLFRSVTVAIEILQQAQIEAEEIYINSSEEEENIRKVIQLVKKESEDV